MTSSVIVVLDRPYTFPRDAFVSPEIKLEDTVVITEPISKYIEDRTIYGTKITPRMMAQAEEHYASGTTFDTTADESMKTNAQYLGDMLTISQVFGFESLGNVVYQATVTMERSAPIHQRKMLRCFFNLPETAEAMEERIDVARDVRMSSFRMYG